MLTVHNLAFQGTFPAACSPAWACRTQPSAWTGWSSTATSISSKAGLAYADRLTTVSPTYAREITRLENGMGSTACSVTAPACLSGILNGIDDAVWNPATDELIPARFSAGTLPRRARQQGPRCSSAWAWMQNPDALLIGVVSRLTSQKGLDMLLDAARRILLADGMQLAMLGVRRTRPGARIRRGGRLASRRRGCVMGYDEGLAHLIQAGSDALLVPSRFEPCGLTQLCALRYGAIPVVSRVGGLADSVIDANEAALTAGVATGIQFWPATPRALAGALGDSLALWRDRPAWEHMQRNGMAADVSWRGSASRYMALYQSILAAETGREE